MQQPNQKKRDREVNKTFIDNYRSNMTWTEMNTLIKQIEAYREVVKDPNHVPLEDALMISKIERAFK